MHRMFAYNALLSVPCITRTCGDTCFWGVIMHRMFAYIRPTKCTMHTYIHIHAHIRFGYTCFWGVCMHRMFAYKHPLKCTIHTYIYMHTYVLDSRFSWSHTYTHVYTFWNCVRFIFWLNFYVVCQFWCFYAFVFFFECAYLLWQYIHTPVHTFLMKNIQTHKKFEKYI